MSQSYLEDAATKPMKRLAVAGHATFARNGQRPQSVTLGGIRKA